LELFQRVLGAKEERLDFLCVFWNRGGRWTFKSCILDHMHSLKLHVGPRSMGSFKLCLYKNSIFLASFGSNFYHAQVLTLHTNLKAFSNSDLDDLGVHRKISQLTFHRFQPRVIWSSILKVIRLQSWLPPLISMILVNFLN